MLSVATQSTVLRASCATAIPVMGAWFFTPFFDLQSPSAMVILIAFERIPW